MAEAVVDGSPMSRFFCHKCSVEIERLLPNYTCPRCASGFIEELESSSNEGSSGMDMNSEELSDGDIDILTLNRSDRDRDIIEMIMGLSNTYTNQQLNTSQQPGGGNRNYVLGSRRRSNWSRNPQDGRRTSSNRRRQESLQMPIENFIQDFIFNLSGAASLSNTVGQDAQPSVFNVRLFLGNPGDYVWGRDGLDAIVTQLLNQMDGTGPPPLSRNQIDEIPTTTITQSQVDCKLQCSVCWEDFKLSEPVRQLPCQHVYHAPCIVPWLELHGTCPICRQNLGDQNQAEANQDAAANIAGSTLAGSSFAALFRAANEAHRTGQPISRTSSTSSSTSSE
ncbi:PREDICTED: E3 ubiquitin-protein ligase RNF126-B isoform X1 [Trachymyrmex septentrionalis]|uniref:E3 ubiquitin-protein ligase RNF126-B isoform X1 n=1 Tax=Trachymyrmex septentrionalis TaxID=34720 RepID=UPI00084F1FBF|nr:PREDICTED: E3 ubiquitin-protein ligase RNF126-B isoform X1 [Trachymyrmex septentrionalis]XP_018346079.1 PREDICTED: E3 ubiquitin-protein ligase RNF126-B isoform X1 [Trachymyrmex septentrionalis]